MSARDWQEWVTGLWNRDIYKKGSIIRRLAIKINAPVAETSNFGLSKQRKIRCAEKLQLAVKDSAATELVDRILAGFAGGFNVIIREPSTTA